MATNGTETPRRDTRNHVLFEVATEVANRGLSSFPQVTSSVLFLADFSVCFLQWEAYIRC